MSTATITSKGQVTIPKAIREALNLEAGGQIIFLLEDDRAIMIPARRRSLSELRGALPATQPFPGHDKIREVIGRQRGDQLAREKPE